ncbi:MAG: lipid-binding SYLF domain-containing protein [Pseudomonadota bacterium]
MNKTITAIFALLLTALAMTAPAHAGKREKAERLVTYAADTTAYFASDSAFEALWGLADDAKAMVIIPNSVRAGFIFGGSAGNALMVSRNDDGSWSQPVFMTVGSISFGFQAGGEASEIILLVMTNRGMEQLLSTSAKLGADLTLAAGPIGAGAKAQTTDIVAFSRSRGLYGGVSLEGAVLKIRHKWNDAYYGADVTPTDIIYKGKAYNPSSAAVQNAVFALANRDSVRPVLAPLEAVNGNEDEALRRRYDEQSADPSALGSQSDPDEAGRYDDDEAWGAPVKRPN